MSGECIDCGEAIRNGSRCQQHRVEHANTSHEFFTEEEDD